MSTVYVIGENVKAGVMGTRVFCDGIEVENVGSYCDDVENGWVEYVTLDGEGYIITTENHEFIIHRRFGKITTEPPVK